MAAKGKDSSGAGSEVASLQQRREQLEQLKRELSGYGVAATEHAKLADLQEMAKILRKEREGKPPCFRRAYSGQATQCRLCDLRYSCAGEGEADTDPAAAYVPAAELSVEPCRVCGEGMLSLDLFDSQTGQVRDYGCSTDECMNTLLTQSGWRPDPVEADPRDDPRDDPQGDPQEDPQRRPASVSAGSVQVQLGSAGKDEAVEKLIVEIIGKAGTVRTQVGITSAVPAGTGKNRTLACLHRLIERGVVTYGGRGKGYWLSGK